MSTISKTINSSSTCQINDPVASPVAFETYDFDSDENFQYGMTQIMVDNKQEGKSSEELLTIAKHFVENYADHGPDFREHFSPNGPVSPTLIEKVDTPRTTLSDIVQLINEGKPIPGIRTIPNIINSDAPSQPKFLPRPKPWEVSKN